MRKLVLGNITKFLNTTENQISNRRMYTGYLQEIILQRLKINLDYPIRALNVETSQS